MTINNISFLGRPNYCKKCYKRIDENKVIRLPHIQ